MRRVAVLMSTAESDPEALPRMNALRQGLQAHGWTEGRNIQIIHRWFANDLERAKVYATELVGLAPDVIVAHTAPAVIAASQYTRVIPIIFVQVADPVGRGIVDNMARPSGNVTGFINLESSIGGKWLQLLKEVAPVVARVAVVFNPKMTPDVVYLSTIRSLAPQVGAKVIALPVHDATEIESAVSTFAREPNGGLLVLPDITTNVHRALIIAQAARYRLPAVYSYRYFATGGGLIAYGADTTDLFRGAASYVDRTLRGAKPSELPVQAPTKYELVVNLKTARTLGLTVSPSLLARADEIIE
jgi:putative ABC transport system substrate-binding protein